MNDSATRLNALTCDGRTLLVDLPGTRGDKASDLRLRVSTACMLTPHSAGLHLNARALCAIGILTASAAWL